MLAEIINNPDLKKYLNSFETGQVIFFEGDDSQDLYILVSGNLDVFKGNKKISQITGTGSLFGEMSFLLEARRTATAKAAGDVTAICIPKEEVCTFLSEFPSVAWEISRVLAQRLDETSQVLYGFKEFCDQLPDAVIVSDKEGKMLSCNSAAETLYGRGWNQMHHKSVEELYEQPETYKTFIEEVQSRYAVREKILKVRHPEKGTRFISTSTTVLYDGHHNFKGVLSLGRDVTAVKNMERKYRRVRYWLIPSFILLALLSAAIFFTYPYIFKGYQAMDVGKRELRNSLAKDFLLLKSLLSDSFAAKDRPKTTQVMKDFCNLQKDTAIPCTGLILLDREKKVFNFYSTKKGIDSKKMIGSSYAAIEFQGSESSLHRVLKLYRTDKEHPMGHKAIEIAFEMKENNRFLGWLIFQMDMELLGREYGINEQDLIKFQFKNT